MKESVVLVSLGRHTRLGDVLERAVRDRPFESVAAADFSGDGWKGRRLLFSASADAYGENIEMRRLTARLLRKEIDLTGAACAMIADGEQGGALRVDALRLLLAANAAGAEMLPRGLLETGQTLRGLALDGRTTPFDRYGALARELADRLLEYEPATGEQAIRLICALEDGPKADWHAAMTRIVSEAGGTLSDADETGRPMLIAQNETGLPDANTLELLHKASGRLTCIVASAVPGGELYALALLDQACLRGNCALAPGGLLLLEDASAAEALADRAQMERVKTLINSQV